LRSPNKFWDEIPCICMQNPVIGRFVTKKSEQKFKFSHQSLDAHGKLRVGEVREKVRVDYERLNCGRVHLLSEGLLLDYRI
jgi:hypothetical protein